MSTLSRTSRAIVVGLIVAGLLLLAKPTDAFEVKGTVTARVVAVSTYNGEPDVFKEVLVKEEWTLSYEFDQGRLHQYRSVGPAKGKFFRHSHSVYLDHLRVPCTIVIEETLEESNLSLHAEPLFLLDYAGQNNESVEPVPLKVEISLPPAFDHEQRTKLVAENEGGCGSNRTVAVTASVNGIRFELPEPLRPPFTSTFPLHFSVPIERIKSDLELAYPRERWTITGVAEIDLVVKNMPVAVATITPEEPKRGDLVAFDSSASQGHYQQAFWYVTVDEEACTKPKVTTATPSPEPPLAGAAAQPTPAMINPANPNIVLGLPITLKARHYEVSDRPVIRTTVLCPLRARLILSEDVKIRSASEEISLKVKPREWNTVFSYDLNLDTGKIIDKFEYVDPPGSASTKEIGLSTYMDKIIPALAANIIDICVFDRTATWLDGCRLKYAGIAEGSINRMKLSSKLLFGLISDGENSIVEFYNGLPKELRPNIYVEEEPGPFSRLYYFKDIPEALFRTIGLLNPVLVEGKAYEETKKKYGGANWVKLIRSRELHEYLHTYFINRYFERPCAASGSSTGPTSGVFDPACVLEQMYDTDLDRLIERAMSVYFDAYDLVENAAVEHVRMKHWRTWVRPQDTYVGKKLADWLTELSGKTYYQEDRNGDGVLERQEVESLF